MKVVLRLKNDRLLFTGHKSRSLVRAEGITPPRINAHFTVDDLWMIYRPNICGSPAIYAAGGPRARRAYVSSIVGE
jgi:hypothetical protein